MKNSEIQNTQDRLLTNRAIDFDDQIEDRELHDEGGEP